MGLSRRQFTKEFKLAAVRQLEQGVSIAEVARGVEGQRRNKCRPGTCGGAHDAARARQPRQLLPLR